MSDWKRDLANEAEKAIFHPMVEDVMREYASNMRFDLDGLPKYGLMKVAMYAATVARALAFGIDPELLRLTPDEATRQQIRMLNILAEKGVPTVVVEVTADE